MLPLARLTGLTALHGLCFTDGYSRGQQTYPSLVQQLSQLTALVELETMGWMGRGADEEAGTAAVPSMSQALGGLQSLCRLTVLQLLLTVDWQPGDPLHTEWLHESVAELRTLTQLTRLVVDDWGDGLYQELRAAMPRCLVVECTRW